MTDPRTAARYPGHVHARLADKMVTEIIAGVLDQRVFGPDRAAMLTVQLPATAAEKTADRDRQAAALRRQLKKIEASQNALMTELEEAGDGTRPAAAEYRQRIRARYRDRAAERAAAEQQLTELETQTAAADDPRSWPPSRVPPASSPPPCPRSARLSTPPWTCRSCTGRTRTR
jgi:hypothetical protein